MTKRKDLISCNMEQSRETKLNRNGIAGSYLPAIISFILLLSIDQATKYWVTRSMELHASIPVIKGVFEIHYIQNPGAAWGILANKQILFYVITVIAMAVGIWFYIRCKQSGSFRDLRVLVILILAGAAGNFVDRLRFRYVIDFLYFKLIDFPVFNIADCYATIGFFLLTVLILFKYKEEDFEHFRK